MSDTIYERDGLSVTRYWGGEKGDCVQITITNEKGYATLTLAEFRSMVEDLERNVKATKNAFWHLAKKEEE